MFLRKLALRSVNLIIYLQSTVDTVSSLKAFEGKIKLGVLGGRGEQRRHFDDHAAHQAHIIQEPVSFAGQINQTVSST